MRGRSLALIWLRPAPIHLMGAKSTLRGRPIKTMRRWPPGLDALAASGQRSTMKSKRKNPRMSGGFVTAGVPGLEPRTNDRRLDRAAPPQLGRNPADFRGFHGLQCTRWYGLIRADSGHAEGVFGSFLVTTRKGLARPPTPRTVALSTRPIVEDLPHGVPPRNASGDEALPSGGGSDSAILDWRLVSRDTLLRTSAV